jgi:hypothetical protein
MLEAGSNILAALRVSLEEGLGKANLHDLPATTTDENGHFQG